jgi:hypothetical protein
MKFILMMSLLILVSSCGKKTEESTGVKIKGSWTLNNIDCFVNADDVEASQAYTLATSVNINLKFRGRSVIYTANSGDCVTNSKGTFKINKKLGSSGAIIDMEMDSCGNGCELSTDADAAPNETVDIPLDVTSSTAQDLDMYIDSNTLTMRAPNGFTGSTLDLSSECGDDCFCYFVFKKD